MFPLFSQALASHRSGRPQAMPDDAWLARGELEADGKAEEEADLCKHAGRPEVSVSSSSPAFPRIPLHQPTRL